MDEFRKQIESTIRHDLGIDKIGIQSNQTLLLFKHYCLTVRIPVKTLALNPVSIEIGFIH